MSNLARWASNIARRSVWSESRKSSFLMGALWQMGSDKYGHWGKDFSESSRRSVMVDEQMFTGEK
jgi:hypothetical protein